MESEKIYNINEIKKCIDLGFYCVLKQNKKYSNYDGIPYISWGDAIAYRYRIKVTPDINKIGLDECQIIIEYKSIEELVLDGWEID